MARAATPFHPRITQSSLGSADWHRSTHRYADAPTADEVGDNSHTDDSHTDDSHTDDSHTDDSHTDDSHTDDSH
ncbi:MAG: hypothetical protein PPP55_03235, partial [Halorubrum sp.]